MNLGSKLLRSDLEDLKHFCQVPRNKILIINGPGQTGKSTLIRQLIKRTKTPVHFATVDSLTKDTSWIKSEWALARLKTTGGTNEAILIIDDIHKIRTWAEVTKNEWDHDSSKKINLKVILVMTSNAISISALENGTFDIYYTGHWSFAEMNAAFGFSPEQYAWFGGYPGPASLIRNENQWREEVSTQIIEKALISDIIQSTRIDKPVLMRQLFELACHHSGEILSLTKILGRLHDAGNTITLSHYLSLFAYAGLVTGLSKYDDNQSRQRGSIPKFQVFNSALLTISQHEKFQTVYEDPAKWARWIESCIGAHLLNASMKHGYSLFYWKHVNHEIDFIMTDGTKTVCIEVNTPLKKRKSGISQFIKTHSPSSTTIIGADGMKWQEFIRIDPVSFL